MPSRALGFRQGTQTSWALAFSLVKLGARLGCISDLHPGPEMLCFWSLLRGGKSWEVERTKALPGAKSRNWTIQHVNLLKVEPESVVPRIECFHPIFQKMRPDKFGGSVTRRMHSLRELGRTYGANIAPATTNSSSFWLTWWVKKMTSLWTENKTPWPNLLPVVLLHKYNDLGRKCACGLKRV